MDQVMRVVKQAGFRLALIETLRALCITLTLGFALLVALRLVERLGGVIMPWADIAPGVFIVAIIGAIVWAFATRTRPIAAARELDERADLRESLSTAICVQSEKDPWSQLIVRSAAERASKVNVGKAIPIATPRLAPAPFCAALALALIWFTVPRVDFWGVAAKRDQAADQERQIQEVKTEFEQGKKKIEEMLSQANVKIDDGEGDKAANEREAPKTLEEARRESVRKLTDMAERLEQMRNGEKGQVMDALKDRMGRLKNPGDQMNDMYRAMARGNFGQAKEDLEKLAQKLGENSDLTAEQKEQLKKQLENMSGQLSKLAADRGELAKSLEQMGMDGRLAADPEALKKAIEEAAKNMTPEQKEQLEKMLEQAQAQQEMGDKMGNMADAMAKLAKGAAEQGMSAEGMQGLEQLAESLSEMELAQSDLNSLEAALSECRGQLAGQCEGLSQCQGGNPGEGQGMPMVGEWKAGDSQKTMGLGSGGPGQGNGGGPEEEQVDFAIEKKKANVQTGQGAIIGTKLVQGSQIRGESVAEFSAVMESSAQAATEALETMQVQREHHDVVKHYFGTLKEKVKAEQAGGAPSGSGGK